jgi:hypothetical protein
MRLIIPVLFIALLCFNFLPSNRTTDLPHFRINLERTADGISAQCTEGCAWKEVAITTRPYATVYLNESGISSKPMSGQDATNSFAFSFKITNDNKVAFRSIHGTAWLKLSFLLKKGRQQTLTEMGMTE